MRVSSKDQWSIVGVLSAYIPVHGAKVKANWSCGLFTNATTEEAYFPRPDLSDAKLSHVSIYDDGLSNANPFRSGTSPDDVGLDGANCTQAVLIGVDLTKSRTDVGAGRGGGGSVGRMFHGSWARRARARPRGVAGSSVP